MEQASVMRAGLLKQRVGVLRLDPGVRNLAC
jgi:hypothetical protein